jgi:hypothetical protein
MANTTSFFPQGLYMQPPLRYKIRELLLLHSAEEIYTTLRSIFNEDYQFYQTLFNLPAPAPASAEPEPAEPEPAAAMQEEPVPAAEAPVVEVPVLRASTKIRIVKKPAPNPLPENHEPSDEPILHPIAAPIVTDATTERDRKMQIKKEQNEKVNAKFEELKSKGIDSYTLLTKDNLKRWVDTERLTYTQIARDHVGITADEIAAIAKGFGIQSHIAKKRAIIIAGRK